MAYLCAAEDSEGTSGTAQSAANTPRYQALDVQGAVLPRITETKATGVYHMGWQPIPLEMGLLQIPTSRPPMGTPLALAPCLR